MTDSRSKRVRIVAALLVFVLWLPALALSFEVFERARAEVGNRMFPRMLHARMGHQFGMQFVDPDAAMPAPPPSPAAEGVREAPAAERPPLPVSAPPAVVAAAERYAHLRVRDDGLVLEGWGEPAIETHLRHVLGMAHRYPDRPNASGMFLGPATATEFEYSIFFATIFRFYTITVTPDPEAGERTIHAVEHTHEMPLEKLEFGNPDPGGLWLAPFYAYRPNHRGSNIHEVTNNFGFWDHDIAVPKPEGVFRIVCLGGSTTHEGPSIDKTYPKRVEALLRERFGDHVEVINAGVIGNTTFNLHTRIEHYLKMEPDIFLFYGGVNDVCHHFFPMWLEQRADENRWLERSHALRRIYNRRTLPDDDDIRAFFRHSSLRNLAAVRYHAQRAGADLVVTTFSFPDPDRIGWLDRLFLDANMAASWGGQGLIHYQTWCDVMNLFNDELTRWSNEEDGPVLLPVATHFAGGAELFADTCHVTEKGMVEKSRVFAELLGDHLVQRPDFPHDSPGG